MTREELNNKFGKNDYLPNLFLMNYIELRLIADALIGINETLNVHDADTMLNRVHSIADSLEELKDTIINNNQ